jgi:hypothetical protein
MDFLRDLFLVLHLLGLAAIVGSAVFVARGKATPALVWGARIQLLTGLILTGIAESGDDAPHHAKIGVKLVVALAVVACAEIANAGERKGAPKPNVVTVAGALAVLNTMVAVFWH